MKASSLEIMVPFGCRRFRPILKIPPREALPALPALGWNVSPTFPAIMTQWSGGIQGYWSDDDQAFIIQKEVKPQPNSDGPLIQVRVDGIEPQLNRPEKGWGWFYAKSVTPGDRKEIHRQIVENDPAPDLAFHLVDLDMEGITAGGRCYWVVNTPSCPGFVIPQCYQVIDAEGYNEVWNRWRDSGWLGAIVQNINDPFSAPHLLCDFVI